MRWPVLISGIGSERAVAHRLALRCFGLYVSPHIHHATAGSQGGQVYGQNRHAPDESENTPASRGEVQLERMNHEVNKRTSYREWYLTKLDIAGNFQTLPINIRTRSLATSRYCSYPCREHITPILRSRDRRESIASLGR